MNKNIVSLAVLAALFGIAGFAFAGSTEPVRLDNPLPGVEDFGTLLEKISTFVAGLVGTISVIMLIIAGILFVTSAGSPEKTTTAKKALTYAIIGIIVALAATALTETIKWVIGA